MIVEASVFFLVAMAPRLGDASECTAVKGLLTSYFGKSPVMGAGTVWFGGSIARMAAEMDFCRGEARTLVLSERTVESHVRNILAKTGLRSRTEITRWWLQQKP